MLPDFTMRFFGAMLAIMNPLSVLPLFLALTDGMSTGARRRTAMLVVFYSAVMCAAVAVAGEQILRLFGISIQDFRIAGGLVVAIIGLNMLNGGGNPAHEGGAGDTPGATTAPPPKTDPTAVAFYPLAFPMMVGPGTIATLLLFVQDAHTPEGLVAYVGVVAIMLGLLAVALLSAGVLGAYMSATLRVIMTRLMGLILLAIAVSMISGGLQGLFPVLKGLAPA